MDTCDPLHYAHTLVINYFWKSIFLQIGDILENTFKVETREIALMIQLIIVLGGWCGVGDIPITYIQIAGAGSIILISPSSFSS